MTEEWRARMAEESARDANERWTPRGVRRLPVTELEVPDASVIAMDVALSGEPRDDYEDIRAIAAPVVAAELRRLAPLVDDTDTSGFGKYTLLDRADELDGGVS